MILYFGKGTELVLKRTGKFPLFKKRLEGVPYDYKTVNRLLDETNSDIHKNYIACYRPKEGFDAELRLRNRQIKKS